ncbi:MAG: peptidoglycan bridge formation glycyltransferase FemA/FemB family protein [Thermoflexales bacterium]|nr:peptidoglycan bridge formation glycyltransferase FemA/FemB family protein [Thermoflexales bacterium]
MTRRLIEPAPAEWDSFVASHPAGHILQTWAWGALKTRFGWQAARLALTDGARLVAGAQVLFRRLPLRLGTIAYVPRGPLVDRDDEQTVHSLQDSLDQLCRAQRAAWLKIEPEAANSKYQIAGCKLQPSSHTVQPPRTIVVDLRGSEEELLARMHAKTRYNIRLAGRKGVTVRSGTAEDLDAFYALMETTGTRDGFGVHSLDYYRAAFELFVLPGHARLLLAQVGDTVVAGVMVFALGEAGQGRAWYFYGASGDAHRDKMPNYALQWEAMRWAREIGCVSYDLWGIPDEDESKLEAHYLERHDGLWGVYRFKRGFGGRVIRYAGAYDRVYNPWLYRLGRLIINY